MRLTMGFRLGSTLARYRRGRMDFSMLFRLLLLLASLALFGAETVTRPFVGVTHIQRTETAFNLHLIRIDLDAPGIRFQLTGPGGSRETVRQTTLDFLTSVGAQVAVNGHFFAPYPSTDSESFLIGLAASEGVVYSSFESPVQSYALVASAPALHIDASNHASIVGPGYAGDLWTAVSGSAQIVTDGVVTVPIYRDDAHPEGLLTPGSYSNTRPWYNVPNPRTVIGLSADKRAVFLVTADRAAAFTVTDLAALLACEYGVHDALNLDGGGSTTLVMQNPSTGAGEVINTPSGGAARAVASSLAVFARRH